MEHSTDPKNSYLADLLFPEAKLGADFEPLDVPREQRRLVTDSFDFTVSTIVAALSDSDIYVPSFQRHFVWTKEQASRLIESLIIQCPIPPIYLNEESDNRLTVVDGNQRLMSIYNFVTGKYVLDYLRTYPDLNGLALSDLDPRIQRHIMTRPLRFITIKKETHPQIKFDVFERINSGSVKLNAQELRHGLFFGPLMQEIDRLGALEAWRAVGATRNDRMRLSELVLRFWAFRYSTAYRKPLESFLNDFAREHRSLKSADLQQWSDEFVDVFTIASTLLGKFAFRTLDLRGKPASLINSALFDAEMIGIARYEHRDKLRGFSALCFQEALKQLLQYNESFRAAISKSTSDEGAVRNRIGGFAMFLKETV